MALWADRMQKWADKRIEEYGSDSKEGQYAFGVSLGVSVAKGKTAPPKNMKKRYKPQAVKGFDDSRWLINKALKHGDAPSGTFMELLQAPRNQPVTGSWSRRDSPD